ncbi:hypothetical protein ABT56_01650 [Photobacterium aquae]|uniref:DUF1449 domain-containing protein n=1 Tax=Photobacterium aquae TaxID=1195763 RepID=A0A0J1HBA3_9GAMM|nr:hypothetical protein [Photobacterium aquae]KLV08935.1 hypothetical protein ABT56_01650 [Photobacterium aquae]
MLIDFFAVLTGFPVIVFFAPFCIFSLLMIIDLMFDLSDGSLGDTDAVDVDAGWATRLFLPPIVSQVPIFIALTITTFFATIIAYYLEIYLFGILPESFSYLVTIPSLFVVFYSALYIAALTLKPLAVVFDTNKAFVTINYEGMRATVRSSKVSSEKGEVVLYQGASEIQLDVYSCGDEDINYGDEVIIVAKHPDENKFLVAKL